MYQWVGTYGYRATFNYASSHYVRARHYSQIPGSWTTVDPLWPYQSGCGYYSGNPLYLVDPSGLEPITLEFNAFIPKRMGQWIPEPGPFPTHEYRGDNRTFNQKGTSRIGTKITIDSCGVGRTGTITNNTGRSHRRKIGSNAVERKASTVLTNTKNSSGTKKVGGPCITFFHAVVKAAYPFALPVAPTQLAIKGWFTVAGKNSISVTGRASHSVFPDWELILEFRGRRTLLYSYATSYPNWSLLITADVFTSFSTTLGAGTDCCCTEVPCCEGECPCP